MTVELMLGLLEECIVGVEKEISWAGKGPDSTCTATHMNLRTMSGAKQTRPRGSQQCDGIDMKF